MLLFSRFSAIFLLIFSLGTSILVAKANCDDLKFNAPANDTYGKGIQSLTWTRDNCDSRVNVYWSETKCNANNLQWKLISTCNGLESDYCLWDTVQNINTNNSEVCVKIKTIDTPELNDLRDINIDNTSPILAGAFTLDSDQDGLIDRIKITFTENTSMNSKITDISGLTVENHQTFFHSWQDNNLFLTINETKDNTGITPNLNIDYNKIKLVDLAGNLLTGKTSITTIDQAPAVILKIYSLDQNTNGKIDSVELQFSEAINDNSILSTDSLLLDKDKIRNNNESLVSDFNTFVHYVDDDNSDTQRNITNDEFITVKVKTELIGTESVYLHVLDTNQISDLAGIKLMAIDNVGKKLITKTKDCAPPVLLLVQTKLANFKNLNGLNSLSFEFSESIGLDINNDGIADIKDQTEISSNDTWGSINNENYQYLNGIGGFSDGYMNESSNNANILQLEKMDDQFKKLNIYFLVDTNSYWLTAMQGLTGKFTLNTDNILVETASNKLDDLAKNNKFDYDVIDNQVNTAKDTTNAFDITPPQILKINSFDYYENPTSNIASFGTINNAPNGNIESVEIEFSEAVLDSTINVYDFIFDNDDKFNFVNEQNAEFFNTQTLVSSTTNNINDAFISLAVNNNKARKSTGAIYVHLLAGSSMRDNAGNRFKSNDTIKTIDSTLPQILTMCTLDTNANGNIDAVEIEFSEPINESLLNDNINLELDNDNTKNGNELLITKTDTKVKYLDDNDELTIAGSANDNLLTFYTTKEIPGTDLAYLHVLANNKIQDNTGNSLPAIDNIMSLKTVKVYDCASPILMSVKAETGVYDGIKGFNTLSFKFSENVGLDTNNDLVVDKLDNSILSSSPNWGALVTNADKNNLLSGLGSFTNGDINESNDSANILQLTANEQTTDQLNIYFLVDKNSYWQTKNEPLNGEFSLLFNNIIIEDNNYSLPTNNDVIKKLKANNKITVINKWDLVAPNVLTTLAIDYYQNPQADVFDLGTSNNVNNNNFEAMEIQFSEAVLDLSINKTAFNLVNDVSSTNPQFWSTSSQIITKDEGANDEYLTLAVANEKALIVTDNIYLQINDNKAIRDVAGNRIEPSNKAGNATKQMDLKITQIKANDTDNDGKINSVELSFSAKIPALSSMPTGIKFYTDTNFDGVINESDEVLNNISLGNDNGDEVLKFYLANNVISTGKIAVVYTAKSVNPILDFKGNELKTTNLNQVDEFTDDNLAPILINANLINTNQIELLFSEVLDNSVYNKNNIGHELGVSINNQLIKIKNVDIKANMVIISLDTAMNATEKILIKSLVNNLSISDDNGNNVNKLEFTINNNLIDNKIETVLIPNNTSEINKITTVMPNVKSEKPIEEWGKSYIEKMVAQGISNLDSNNSSLINEHMNRAEFVTLVVKAFNLNINSEITLDFADVDNNSWYAPYLQTAVKANLITGSLEEEQIAVQKISFDQKDKSTEIKNWQRILKLLGYNINITGVNDQASITAIANYQKRKGFKIATGVLSKDTINSLNSEKIVMAKTTIGSGNFKKMFHPSDNITRAAAIKIAVLASGAKTNETNNIFADVPSNEWFTEYVNYAAEKNIVQGRKKNTFMPGDAITRAEAAKIILNILELEE